MAWEVEVTDQFVEWYDTLDEIAVEKMEKAVTLLEEAGPLLGRPFADRVRSSRFGNMKELRVQVSGDPLRVFFAFDPRQTAILLLGGDKTGDDRFYDRMVPIVDDLYAEHLVTIRKEREHG